MKERISRFLGWKIFCGYVFFSLSLTAAEIFRVATFNLENYLDRPVGTRPAKPAAARAKIRESIGTIRPDVIALQEVGSTNALLELRSSLKMEGLDYPYWEHVKGFDTNIFVAVLSRFPFTARQSHESAGYLLHGRRLKVNRGFADVDIQVTEDYTFTLISAHLKSRRRVGIADHAEMREREAQVLRRIVSRRLGRHPRINLILLGDFNDTANSKPIRILKGRGKKALLDTRPAEKNGDNLPHPIKAKYAPRRVTWTHHYGVEDVYSRVDYILLSPGMTREWLPEETHVLALPNWGLASDHRLLVAGFGTYDQ